MKAHHFVALAHPPHRPFENRETCAWFWRQLMRGYRGEILAAILMPDHVHLVVSTSDPERARMRLVGLVGGLVKRTGMPPGSWKPVELRPPAHNATHLLR